MDISIVINCSDDFHVFRTIKSIDEDVEIIVSLTANQEIQRRLTKLNIPFAVTPKGSQSVTTNAGIKLVSFEKFILMDSDCYFEPGFIRSVFCNLDRFLIVNGNIIFDSHNSWLSKAISECKKFDDTYDGLVHKPGLGLRKSLLPKIGGYWFDELLKWAEDSELSYRIEKAGVSIFNEKSSIHHLPTTYKHNLSSCFLYGTGDYFRYFILKQKPEISILDYEIKRYRTLIKEMFFDHFLIMITNDISYQLGYIKGIILQQSGHLYADS